jgi:hypothetical protein
VLYPLSYEGGYPRAAGAGPVGHGYKHTR